MEQYIPLTLKYRPKRLSDVVGQDNIVTMLNNSVKMNKINRVYLFTGPAGTGKTSIARIWSSMLNCNSDVEKPCCECNICKSIANGNSIDVIELNSADKRKIEDIRELLSRIRFKPTSKYKIIIMDEVHMLTTEAWNALLKDLEEPPEYCVFILCTTNPEKIPNTILSRCISFEFHSVSDNDIKQRLEYICDVEGFIYEDEALEIISEKSNGGMRDALSTLERIATFSANEILLDKVVSSLDVIDKNTFDDIILSLHNKDVEMAISIVDDLISKSKTIDMVYNTLQNGYIKLVKEYYKHIENKIRLDRTELLNVCKIIVDYESKIKFTNNKYIVLISLLNEISNVSNADYISRLENIEARVNNMRNITSDVVNKSNIDRLKNLVNGKSSKLDKFKENNKQQDMEIDNDITSFADIIGGTIL